jgi:O-antigen/teichoic acid export membrane protein
VTRRRTQSRLLGESLIMLAGSVVVSVLNFSYNVAVARLLGHVAVVITLLMFVSSITLSFQLVCAKLVARNDIVEAKGLCTRACCALPGWRA